MWLQERGAVMPIIQCNGIHIHYEVSGSGPAVLLLHGNSADLHFFDALTEKLRGDYTVYRMDSRCHGQSEKTGDLNYDLMTQDTAAFIKALDIHRPALIGSSDGGITGLLLSIAHPGLLSCHVPCGANATVAGLKRWFYWMFRLGYLKTRSPMFGMVVQQPDITPQQLKSITTPTLVMAGSRDIMTNAHTRYLARAIPGARLCLLPGETHTSYLRKPDVFMAHAGAFLDAKKEMGAPA